MKQVLYKTRRGYFVSFSNENGRYEVYGKGDLYLSGWDTFQDACDAADIAAGKG